MLDSLCQFLKDNNIPVLLATEMEDILRDPDPYENIIPAVNVDIDSDGIPDGHYEVYQSFVDTTDGLIETDNMCWSTDLHNQEIIRVDLLYGVEKGWNEVGAWVKKDSLCTNAFFRIHVRQYNIYGEMHKNIITTTLTIPDTTWNYVCEKQAFEIDKQTEYIRFAVESYNPLNVDLKITAIQFRKLRL